MATKKTTPNMSPVHRRILTVHQDAQKRIGEAQFWGNEPDPKDLAMVAECELRMKNLEEKKKSPARSLAAAVVKLPDISPEERKELQEVAARLKLDRESQVRTEILEAMRIVSIAGMPRTRKEAQKGRYQVVFPLAADHWCRVTLTADLGETSWGADRVWMKVLQTWAAEALRKNPETRFIEFPSYRSILDSLGLDTGGWNIDRMREAFFRLGSQTWRFDFGHTMEDVKAGRLKPGTRPEFIRFSLIDAARLPSKLDVEREIQGEQPLRLPVHADATMPYYLRISETMAQLLLDPKERHIMPQALVERVLDEPLTLDFWDFCLQWAKRSMKPAVVRESLLMALFGQGWTRKRDLLDRLEVDLARLIEACAPQFQGEFRKEPLPRVKGKTGPVASERNLIIYPLRGPIEYLPGRGNTPKTLG